MSGYVGYLGKYRHSSDGRHATDIRRASAEHQGLEYVEEPETHKEKRAQYTPSSQYSPKPYDNRQSPVANNRAASKPNAAQGVDDFSYVDAEMAQSHKHIKEASACKVVYKKSRKISMGNFNS